jgi:histidine decarboxylase
MKDFFSKEHINSIVGPFNQYCVGYPGQGNYLTALTMGIGSFKKNFSHPGSKRLDSIIAYDRAEISDAYIGQINMIMVSSFCGPQGLIWGYDVVKEESETLPSFLSPEEIREFGQIKIRNGKNLRKAAKALFGSNEKRHFPFLPGTHVPCAGKFQYKEGPTCLYGAIAIGIPENRNNSACLLMEDVGEITIKDKNIDDIKKKISFNVISSVLEIGKCQKINYKEIFVDLISKEIYDNEIGCVLVTMPYFLLAKKAFNDNLAKQNLSEWVLNTKQFFLNK